MPKLDELLSPRAIEQAEENFSCEISAQRMQRPVIALTGKSFDDKSAKQWAHQRALQQAVDGLKNDITDLDLSNTRPNFALKFAIREWEFFKSGRYAWYYEQMIHDLLKTLNQGWLPPEPFSVTDFWRFGFICPLTKEFYTIPVTTPEGDTYDQDAIENHLKVSSTDPFTGRLLTREMLVINRNLWQLALIIKKHFTLNKEIKQLLETLHNKLKPISDRLQLAPSQPMANMISADDMLTMMEFRIEFRMARFNRRIVNCHLLIFLSLFASFLIFHITMAATNNSDFVLNSYKRNSFIEGVIDHWYMKPQEKAGYLSCIPYTVTNVTDCEPVLKYALKNKRITVLERLSSSLREPVFTQLLIDTRSFYAPSIGLMEDEPFRNHLARIKASSPLIYAAWNGDEKAVLRLLNLPKVIINLEQNGLTALIAAVVGQLTKYPYPTDLLTKEGFFIKDSEPNESAIRRDKPSNKGAHNNVQHLKVIDLLLKHGAELDLQDNKGRTVRMIADANRMTSTVKQLDESLVTLPSRSPPSSSLVSVTDARQSFFLNAQNAPKNHHEPENVAIVRHDSIKNEF